MPRSPAPAALLFRRSPRRRAVAFRGPPIPAPDGPRYPIGVNVFGPNSSATTWDSVDLLACASDPRLDRIQATLAAPYAAGSGVLRLADPNPFTIGVQGGKGVAVSGVLHTAAGAASFAATAVGGSPYVYITSWGNAKNDVDYPAGTYVDHSRSGWTNSSRSPADWPVAPEFVTPDGRHTGYPAGLNAGQTACIPNNTNLGAQPGAYTILAAGTGALRFVLWANGGIAGSRTINIAAGVPAGPLTIAPGQCVYQVWLVASSPADPLHDVQVVVPDRPGRADGFVAARLADGPRRFRVHPDFVASLRPYRVLRYMDPMGTNSNPNVLDWSDRPSWDGLRPGIGAVPYEYLAELANEVGAASWWCMPITASDDYVSGLAAWTRDNIDPSLRVAFELGNEDWNSIFTQFIFVALMGVASYSPAVVRSIAFDPASGTCTVAMPGHGFKDDDVVQLCNAADDAYNGAYPVTVVDKDTFTYRPATAPGSTAAVPIRFHNPMAFATAAPAYLPVATATFDGRHTITLTTATPHGLGWQDVVQLCNAADPAYDGLYLVADHTPGATTFTLDLTGQGYNHPFPSPDAGPGVVPIAPKDGQQLAIRCVACGHRATGPGQVGTFAYQQRWVGERKARIDRILADAYAGQEDRLILVLAWQMPFSPAAGWLDTMIAAYCKALGGSFLPGVETAISCAPYFDVPAATSPAILGQPRAIASIAYSVDSRTCTATSPGHGFADGDDAMIANALEPAYCGVHPVAVIDADTFSYTPRAVPSAVSAATPAATPANSAIPAGAFAAPPALCREVTATAVNGSLLTCTSPGHGWAAGQAVVLCGAAADRPAGPAPANHGGFAVVAADADTFTVAMSPSAAPPAAGRLWAWDPAALDLVFAALAPLPVLAQQFAGAAAASKKWGLPIRGYECGASLTLAAKYPPLADIERAANYDPRMGDTYRAYFRRIYDEFGATSVNQYNHIDPFYFWGLKRYQHEPNPPKWTAVMGLCDGVPDYADGGAPPPPPPTRRWFAPAAR
jgi:hypothetical protein